MAFITLTATTPGECACCGIGGVDLSCRTRGGTASLVGCAEYTTPSSPPKRYRRSAMSGATDTNYYTFSDSACATPPSNTTHCTYTAFTQYSVTTGLPTDGGSIDCGSGPGPGGNQCIACPADTCMHIYVCAPTTIQRMTTGNCCFDGGGSNVYFKKISDTLTWTLSDEDTEDDAIDRLLAGAGGTWSAWAPVGDGTGGTCVGYLCCQANYQQRTGFSFGYHEAQFKADMTLLIPSTNYILTLIQYRRLYGSVDPWVQLVVDEYPFTTDGSGNAQVTGDVLNLVGYETYIGDPVVSLPP